MLFIAAEGFTLTPAIKEHVNFNIKKLTALVPQSARFEVFMSEPAHHDFMVVIKTHIWGKDLVVRSEGENLYRVVEKTRLQMHRKIAEQKHRWVHNRRKEENSKEWTLSYTA